MRPRSNIKIISDGTYHGSRIEVDGVVVNGIRLVSVTLDPDEYFASAELEVLAPQMDFDGPAFVEKVEVEGDVIEDVDFDGKRHTWPPAAPPVTPV